MSTNAKALVRLALVIEGVSKATTTNLLQLVEQLAAAGMGDAAIRKRIEVEMVAGQLLAPLRQFATATVPGFTGDLAFRFARDTLSQEASKADIRRQLEEARREATPEEKERATEILNTYKEQGIDTSAAEDELPEPPPDASLDDLYYWIGIEDDRQCEICAANHEKSQQGPQPLSYWVDVGEPRSGACAGRENCRCILVPAQVITKKEVNEVFKETIKIPK